MELMLVGTTKILGKHAGENGKKVATIGAQEGEMVGSSR